MYGAVYGAKEEWDLIGITLSEIDIFCISEYLLLSANCKALNFFSDFSYYIQPAKSTRGHTSGGLLIAVRNGLWSNLL